MNENSSSKQNKYRGKLKLLRFLPLLLGAVAIAIIVIVMIKVHVWNIGETYEVDPNLILETETEDVFFMEPLSNRWQAEDDGKRTIVIFGNDTFAYDDNENSIPDIISEKTDATVYNCTFTGSTITSSSPVWDEDMTNPMDAFCFYWLADSAKNGDFSRQTNALSLLGDSIDTNHYTMQLKNLQGVNFTSVDLIIFAYDATDYCLGADTFNESEPYSITSICGSIAGTFDKFKINFPKVQLMVVAPTFCYIVGEDGTKIPCDLADNGHGTLTNCLTHLRDYCFEYEVTYLDNYYGIAITQENADEYLLSDNRTPNQVGRNMIAVRTADKINLYWAEAN